MAPTRRLAASTLNIAARMMTDLLPEVFLVLRQTTKRQSTKINLDDNCRARCSLDMVNAQRLR
jgi:hypothetical protein